MRGGRLALLAAAAALAASAGCRSTFPVDVRVSMPGVSPFAPDAFKAVLIAPFREDAPLAEFKAGEALTEALEAGLRRELRSKNVTVARADVTAEAGSDDAAVWKSAGASKALGTVYLAGAVKLAGDVRKALDKNSPADGPFDLVARLIAKRRWRLTGEVCVISAATGEVLHRRAIDEYQDYGELDKPVEFAFAELSDRVLARLKQVLCATPTIEVRTLLRR